ncbi:MAG: tyrosine-type recombinase/integrase [Phycisphaerales bacterium JB059]
MGEITRADVKRLLLTTQQEGLAPGTVQNFMAFDSGLFTHAYEDDILDRNPALRLGRFIQKDDRRKDIRPLTRDQASTVLTAPRESFPADCPLLLCAFRTGMRMGELLGLVWAKVDFEANAIEVRRSYSHSHFDTPKPHRSRRVDMSGQLAPALRVHGEALLPRHGGRLPTTAVQLVFPSQIGGPRDGDNLRRRVFDRLLEIADAPRFRFHDIGHTFASLLLQQGESLHYVEEQLGHASIQTTTDVDGHLVPGSNRHAVNRLDDPAVLAIKLVQGSAG